MLSQHLAAKCVRYLCRAPLACLRCASQWLRAATGRIATSRVRVLCPESSKVSIAPGSFVFTYLLGIVLFSLVPVLPPVPCIYLIGASSVPLIIISVFIKPWLRLLSALLLGVFWAGWYGLLWQQHRLPESLERQAISVNGHVTGLPADLQQLQRFDFQLDPDTALPVQRLRLSWYGGPQLLPGQRWQFQLKLRRPRGSRSPGAFDYEAWALRENVQATGYIISGELLDADVNGLMVWRDRLRQSVRDYVYSLGTSGTAGLLVALLVGDKSGINPVQWQILNQSGTTHLMVISGLHIGLMASLGFWFTVLLGRAGCLPLRTVPLPRLAALAGLGLAVGYAFLAGFSIPVQRALVMSGVALSGPLFGVRARPSTLFLLALALVLTMTPMAWTSAGFWYSFLAVAALLYGFAGRVGANSCWRRWGQPQWVVFILLLPMLLFHGQSVSLLSPVINLVAIPLVAGLVVPLALLSLLSGLVYQPLGQWLLIRLDEGLAAFMYSLSWLAEVAPKGLLIQGQSYSWLSLLLAIMAGLLTLSPTATGLRKLAVFMVLPWLLPKQRALEPGHAAVAILDVGQGLSILVRTRSHSLLYDTGDVFASGFSMAERVVIPYLQNQGVRRLDRVVISHGDQDHAGGLTPVQALMPSAEIWAGSALTDFSGYVHPCQAGQVWEWDQVRLEFLAGSGGQWSSTNDRSCILRISANQQSLLLTGDISQKVENALVALGTDLRSEYLLLPHHGSKYSGSSAFLQAVQPEVVLVSAGFKNRFGHPSPVTLERLDKLDAEIWNTAEQGTIEFVLGDETPVTSSRQRSSRYWHQP